MKKYREYVKEKYNREIIEHAHGFLSYEAYDDNSVYVDILFVDKDNRKKGIGKQLESLLIEKVNPWVIFCDVDKCSNKWEDTLVTLTNDGYTVFETLPYKIVLCKEIYESK